MQTSDIPGPPSDAQPPNYGGAGYSYENVRNYDDALPPPPMRRADPDGAASREDLEEKGKRDELREERKRERERERRLEAKNQAGAKRSKITRYASSCIRCFRSLCMCVKISIASLSDSALVFQLFCAQIKF